MWIEPEQTPSSGPRNLEPRRGLFAASAVIAPIPQTGRVAANAKRPDPRKDCLGPEAQIAANRKAAQAANRSRSTSLVKSRTLAAGELYDQNGRPIGAVADAGGNGRGNHTETLIAVPKGGPHPIVRVVKAIPPWGWLALVVAVGVGANAVLGGGSGGSPFDDVDVDEDDDDEQDEAA